AITVTPVYDAGVATDYGCSTLEAVVLSVAAPGLLANDSDVENDPLTAALVSGPAHGTLTLNADGSFVYSANANYNGPDSFTYQEIGRESGREMGNVAVRAGQVDDA